MDGGRDRWMDGRVNGGRDGWMDEWMDRHHYYPTA